MEKTQSNDVLILNNKNSYEILKEMIQSYEGTLNPEIMKILYSLIGLEISVLKDTSIEKMKQLMKIDIYRLVAYYNIYQRSINLIQQNSQRNDLKVLINNSSSESLCNLFIDGLIPDTQRQFCILQYVFFSKKELRVNLYETSNDSVIHEQRISDLEATIIKLETDLRNADDENLKYILYTIETYKRKLEELKNIHLTPEKMESSKLQQYLSSLLLEEYGIKDIDLLPEKKDIDPYRDNIDTTLTYVKRYPSITITKIVS